MRTRKREMSEHDPSEPHQPPEGSAGAGARQNHRIHDRLQHDQLHGLVPGKLGCLPSTTFDVDGVIYVACHNHSENSISLLQLSLKHTDISNSFASHLGTIRVNPADGDVLDSSQFVIIDVGRRFTVVFAVGRKVFWFRPLLYASGVYAGDLPESCRSVGTRLERLGEYTLLAYCGSIYYMYDKGEQDWLYGHMLGADNQPHPCTGHNLEVIGNGSVLSVRELGDRLPAERTVYL